MLVRGGTVYDGSGRPGVRADVLIDADKVAGVRRPAPAPDGVPVLDATGLAVVPGFINVLSHAWMSLQADGSAASEVLQGVTTEVFGEASSPGPSDARLGAYFSAGYEAAGRGDFRRLADGLDAIAAGGVAPNVASFVGGENLRYLGAGFAERPLTPAELDRVRGVLAEELQDGALGLGTALIYPPGRYASTDELAALCEVVAAHDGLYASHLRSEADALLDGVAELFTLSERTGVRAQIYHLKAAGPPNWPKMATVIERVSAARVAGLQVSANMYPYTAGSNHLAGCVPPRFADGGPAALAARLADPAARAEIATAIAAPGGDFENLFLAAGGGDGVLLLRDLADGTPARGLRLAEFAARAGVDDVTALLRIVATDPWLPAAFFIADPVNVELGLRQPWVCIGSDAAAHPAAPPWSDRAAHPRTYGTFARVLGHYRRERGLFSFPEAVRRMTSLPADTLRLPGRGRLVAGGFADLCVLDPAAIADRATWDEPHQYAAGVRHVLVNGVLTVRDGQVTTARAGRRLRRDGAS